MFFAFIFLPSGEFLQTERIDDEVAKARLTVNVLNLTLFLISSPLLNNFNIFINEKFEFLASHVAEGVHFHVGSFVGFVDVDALNQERPALPLIHRSAKMLVFPANQVLSHELLGAVGFAKVLDVGAFGCEELVEVSDFHSE